MNIFKALVMREILDGKNGYIRVPIILAGLTIVFLFLSSIGLGNGFHFDGMEREGIENLGDAIALGAEKEAENLPAAIAMGYWAMTSLPWVAFPFVVFFSLLGSLYEERRDRSILFWKSMPTADWQEVLAKFFVPVVIAPLIFLAVVIAAQLVIALLLSIVVLFQGGPMLEMWPLGLMIKSWFAGLSMYYIHALWVLPLFAWLSLVSAYANRMPFLWAILAPAILIVSEIMIFDHGRHTSYVGRWIGMHMGGWMEGAFRHYENVGPIDGPRDVLAFMIGGPQWDALVYTLGNLQFWAGLVIAGGFIYASIEMRKRAI